MKARMEKYDVDTSVKKRTTKNEKLYSEVGNMNIDYVDIDVDNAVELNPTKSGRTSREDFQKQRELNKILPKSSEVSDDTQEYVEAKEDRVYDINEILSMARKNQLFEDSEKKRLINTEYNILSKLDVGQLENENMKKEDLNSLIDDIYEKEAPKKVKKTKKYSRSEEARLLNDLFEDTITKDNINLQEELSKAILDDGKDEEQEPEEIIEEEQQDLEDTQEEKEEEKEKEEEVVATQIIPEPEEQVEEQPEPKEDTTTMYDFGIEKKPKKKKEKSENMLKGINLAEAKKASEAEAAEELAEEQESKLLIVAIIIVVILILLTCGFFVYEYFFGLK